MTVQPFRLSKRFDNVLPTPDFSISKLRFWAEINSIDLQAAEKTDEGHPFTALVTYGGRPSDNFVGGTEDIEGGPYRVLIPAKVLSSRIGDLVGKKIFANDTLDSHSRTLDIGEFKQAWVETKESPDGTRVSAAKAAGNFYPQEDTVDVKLELIAKVVEKAKAGILGLSYDLKEARFRIEEVSGEKIVVILDFKWRGATALLKTAAAYEFTQLAASAKKQEENMSLTGDDLKKALEAAFSEFSDKVVAPITTKIGEVAANLTKTNDSVDAITASVKEMQTKVGALEAAQQPASDPKPAPAAPVQTAGKEIGIEEFVAAIGDKFTEALKPVVEKLDTINAGTPKQTEPGEGGKRKSFNAESFALLEKYAQAEEGQEPNVEVYKKAIEAVKIDASINDDKKSSLLRDLGAEKRRLERQEAARQQLGL